MARRPNDLSQRPTNASLEDPRGDVLADVLGVSLIGRALYRRVEARAPWGVRAEARDRALFYLLARGAALLEIDGFEPVALSAGDLVFLPHGTAHVLRDAKTSKTQLVCDGERPAASHPRVIGGSGAPTSIIAGFFELGPRPTLLARMPQIVLLVHASVASDEWVRATTQMVIAESGSPGPASAFILQRLADVLFVHALRSLVPPRDCRHAPRLRALADPAVARALTVMHAQITTRWTLAALARRAGVSRSALALRFRELVGEPPLTYLARWRTTRAAELLRETDDAVAEIARRVGYESVPSFTKAFKRWQGTSPGAHRLGRS